MAIDIINLALNFNFSGPHPHISNIILWLNDIPFYPHEFSHFLGWFIQFILLNPTDPFLIFHET
jgi:hypothetical protein